MSDHIELGKRGEEAVARRLAGQGYRILARNFACPTGELDIVAGKDASVLFVEVKSRIGEGGLNQALGPRQIVRLKRMARIFLRLAGLWESDYAFCVAYVLFRSPSDPAPRIIVNKDPF
jgi:putative endonuclease